MKYKLFRLFMEEFNVKNDQVTIMTKIYNKMIQFTFRGDPEAVCSWLSEVCGEIVYIEICKLHNTTAVISYGIPYNGEIHKFERNSLELEIEHLNYDQE